MNQIHEPLERKLLYYHRRHRHHHHCHATLTQKEMDLNWKPYFS